MLVTAAVRGCGAVMAQGVSAHLGLSLVPLRLLALQQRLQLVPGILLHLRACHAGGAA